MADEHRFETHLQFPADPAQKLPPAADFVRDSWLGAEGHPAIPGASAPVFGGHARGYNPEELLILSLSECHMLTYLALAAKNGLAVRRYEDHASGRLGRAPGGKTQMLEVVLRPRVTVVRGADLATARSLHEPAHRHCFMANSVNFPVLHEPDIAEE